MPCFIQKLPTIYQYFHGNYRIITEKNIVQIWESSKLIIRYDRREKMAGISGTNVNSRLNTLSNQAETLLGNDGNDTIVGTARDELILGTPGSNYIKGDQGNDSLYAGPDDDTLFGGEGNDLLVGSLGNNVLYGNEGDDLIYGGGGSNVLFGNQGNDWLVGGPGNDTLYGGQDNDTVFGGDGDDLIFGDKGNDVLYGNEGNDTLHAVEGNNLLFGNQGNDLLIGGEGDDTLYGGQDNDTVFGGNGNNLIFGDRGDDVLFGNGGNDTIYGGEGNDLIVVESGNNWLSGNEGNDSLYGGSGNDTLYAEQGNNFLSGGSGNDVLVTGIGSDTLTGGEGRDRFILARGTGNINRESVHIITDFTFGEDEIELLDELRFENLNFIEESGDNFTNTLIQDLRTGEYLALLLGVRKIDIEVTRSAFIEPPPPPDSQPVIGVTPVNPFPRQPRQVFVANETTPLGAIAALPLAEESPELEYELLDVVDSEGESVSGLLEFDPETREILLTSTEDWTEFDYFDIEFEVADLEANTTTLEIYRVYTSIQTAIAESNAGDTIVVSAGTYSEQLNIDKALTLKGFYAGVSANDSSRGGNETIISNEDGGISIRILASNVTLDGIQTNGDILAVEGDNGTIENVVIENVRIFDAIDGINLEDAASAIIENNVLRGSGGIVLGLFDSTMRATVRNNILEGVEFGILGALSESDIEDNQVILGNTTNLTLTSDDRDGVGIKLVSNSQNVTLANNAIANAQVGIVVASEVMNATLEDNQFSNTPEEIRLMAGNNPALVVIENQPVMNIITGSSGNDSLDGTSRNDLIFPGNGVDTLTGGKGQDIFVYATRNPSGTQSDRITDFSFGPQGDAIALTKNLSAFSSETSVNLSKASLIDGTETVIVDTEENILAITRSNARIGYATDTGKLYVDNDGNFTAGAIALVDLGIGSLTPNNILFLD
jgi:Ca2+-binding RTX toxin-like protein